MELKSQAKAVAEAATVLAATTGSVVVQQQQSVDEKYLGLWSFMDMKSRIAKQGNLGSESTLAQIRTRASSPVT